MSDFADAVSRMRDGLTRGDPYRAIERIQARMASELRAQQADWERRRPVYERAMAIMAAANERRRHELGMTAGEAKIPVYASMWASAPLWMRPPGTPLSGYPDDPD